MNRQLIPYAGKARPDEGLGTGSPGGIGRLTADMTATYRAAGLHLIRDDGPGARELKALRAKFRPRERADLTGRLLGDPPAGRSALDQRGEHS